MIVSIQDSEHSKLLAEYLSNAANNIEESYDISYTTFSLEYFLELEYSDLLGNKYHRVYQVITGISEGFQQNPSPKLIIDVIFVPSGILGKMFPFFEASTEPEAAVDPNEQIDLEEQDPEYVYRFVKETVQSYTSWNHYRGNQENHYFSPRAGRNREYALIIEKPPRVTM